MEKARTKRVIFEVEQFRLSSGFLRARTVIVMFIGNIDRDGKVDSYDLLDFSEAYGSKSTATNWNAYCDSYNDGKVDTFDIFDLGKNYGKTDP